MKLDLKPYAFGAPKAIGVSDNLAGTTNFVFSKMGMVMTVFIDNNTPIVMFEIVDDWRNQNPKVLLETNDYKEFVDYIENHKKEIEEELKIEEEKWFEKYSEYKKLIK